MKEYDYVEVIVEKEKYAKQGVHKGMQGTILDPRKIEGCWLVYFPDPVTFADDISAAVKEEDLKLIYENPTEPVVVRVELLNDKYESQGIRKGAIGILRDITPIDGKFEVEFGDKKLMLARDEIEEENFKNRKPIEIKVELLNDKYESQGIRKGSIGILHDITRIDGKFEVEFGNKKLMLARDEIEEENFMKTQKHVYGYGLEIK